MTCDGKTMFVTQRELESIAHIMDAENPIYETALWDIGVLWLAMCGLTAYRWVGGVEYPEPIKARR